MLSRTDDVSYPVRVRRPACPCHGLPLDGGPSIFWCPATGGTVHAADLSNEFVAVTR